MYKKDDRLQLDFEFQVLSEREQEVFEAWPLPAGLMGCDMLALGGWALLHTG